MVSVGKWIDRVIDLAALSILIWAMLTFYEWVWPLRHYLHR